MLPRRSERFRCCGGVRGGEWDEIEDLESVMSAPLSSGRPGRSEYSHGKGKFANPESDYTRGELPWEPGQDKRDVQLRLQAEKRLDATNSVETVEEMYTAKGNPDAFGPDAPLVQEPVMRRPSVYKQPELRYGVYREE